MGCCASKPAPAEELPLADLRALIERSPPDKKEELERVARLKEVLSKAVSDIDDIFATARTMGQADVIVAHALPQLKADLGEFPDEVWAWPEGKRYLEEIARLEAASAPKTNESIRQAVAEFKAESAAFDSPNAERKWGPLAYWNVSEVTDMNQ